MPAAAAVEDRAVALTHADSAVIMSVAEEMQERSVWGPLERVRGDGIDGFYVYNREGCAPIGLICRGRTGEYALRDRRGACLAIADRISELLAPPRLELLGA